MAVSPLLDPQTIAKGEQLGLQARQVVEGFLSGNHKSPYRGFSVEFTQHREYVPGDDLRHLDWKVLGKNDKYVIKQYEAETNFVAHLMLDGSESMQYGSGAVNKLAYARQVAACLSYLILTQRDAVTLSLFDTETRVHVPRTGALMSVHDICRQLAAWEPTGSTAIGPTLHKLAGRAGKRGIVVLISDLFDNEEELLSGMQHLRFAGHEVIVLHVMDPFELEFPFNGAVEFDGMEVTERIKTRPKDVRKTYMAELQAFLDRVRYMCERNNAHYMLLNTSHPLHEAVSSYLTFRMRVKNKRH